MQQEQKFPNFRHFARRQELRQLRDARLESIHPLSLNASLPTKKPRPPRENPTLEAFTCLPSN